MLPCDVQPMLAAQQGQQSGLPRLGPSFIRHGGSRSSKPAQRGLYGKSHGYGPSSSQPCPIPSSRTHAVALAEAPTSSISSTVEHTIDLGFDRDIERLYEWGRQLGKGGNGVVRIVTDRLSGTEYACKAIKKVLSEASSDKKKAGHIDSIKREVEVLRRLSGSLNIIRLVDVFEDDENVYIVQECCKGGELCDRIGEKHYSERTVASYMRAVLRTLAQCHSHHILHRDIKPGNFMLLDDSERAPLKAIDFGLAVPYDPDCLPLTDLGLEGTPWYMAPEVLSSQVTPAADLWAAGVMAHQLLTGRLPFDDHRNPFAPSISAVWRSVLTDKINFSMPWWNGISDEGKDFVFTLLNRDPTKRPTAKEALKHPWLRGNSSERSMGRQIDLSVVQRIQRFAQNNHFKRSVLQLIAEELLGRPGAIQSAAVSVLAAEEGGDLGAAAVEPMEEGAEVTLRERSCPLGEDGRPIITCPTSSPMQHIFERMRFKGEEVLEREQVAAALEEMGYRLAPCEVQRLVEQVDTSRSGKVRRAALAASQVDWRHLQQNNVAEWLEIAQRAFAALDKDKDGVLRLGEIMSSIRAKLPEDELQGVIHQALQEAGVAPDAEHMDFDGFLRMLKVGSVDSLDQYDDRWERWGTSPGSLDRLQSLLDASHHGSESSGGSHHGSLRNGRKYAEAGPAAAVVAAAAADVEDPYKDRPWRQPKVAFNFSFAPVTEARAPPETQGVPSPAEPSSRRSSLDGGSVPAAPEGGNNISYFNNGAVRGGGHFDRRMHGASLYRNAVVTTPGRALYNNAKQLAPVKE